MVSVVSWRERRQAIRPKQRPSTIRVDPQTDSAAAIEKEPRANVDGLCTLAQETEAAPPEKYCQPLLYGDAIGERTPAVSSDNDVLRAGEGRRNQFQVTALKEYKHS